LMLFLVRSAWMAEDAYISFRVTDNFLHGYGLRWNVDERVQVYTDPLFLAMVTFATWVSGNVFFAGCAVSLILTLVAFLILTRRASTLAMAVITIALLFSKGFMDFSVSGLENPATHLAMAAFFLVYWKNRDPFLLSLNCGLAATNRIDSVLLLLPALAVVYLNAGPKIWKRALAGWSPYIAWTAFALFYYGFCFSEHVLRESPHGNCTSRADFSGPGVRSQRGSLRYGDDFRDLRRRRHGVGGARMVAGGRGGLVFRVPGFDRRGFYVRAIFYRAADRLPGADGELLEAVGRGGVERDRGDWGR